MAAESRGPPGPGTQVDPSQMATVKIGAPPPFPWSAYPGGQPLPGFWQTSTQEADPDPTPFVSTFGDKAYLTVSERFPKQQSIWSVLGIRLFGGFLVVVWGAAGIVIQVNFSENGVYRDPRSSDTVMVVVLGMAAIAIMLGLAMVIPTVEGAVDGSDRGRTVSAIPTTDGGKTIIIGTFDGMDGNIFNFRGNSLTQGFYCITVVMLAFGVGALLGSVLLMADHCEDFTACCWEGNPIDPCICCGPAAEPLLVNLTCTSTDGVQDVPWTDYFVASFVLVIVATSLTVLYTCGMCCLVVAPNTLGKFDNKGTWDKVSGKSGWRGTRFG